MSSVFEKSKAHHLAKQIQHQLKFNSNSTYQNPKNHPPTIRIFSTIRIQVTFKSQTPLESIFGKNFQIFKNQPEQPNTPFSININFKLHIQQPTFQISSKNSSHYHIQQYHPQLSEKDQYKTRNRSCPYWVLNFRNWFNSSYSEICPENHILSKQIITDLNQLIQNCTKRN